MEIEEIEISVIILKTIMINLKAMVEEEIMINQRYNVIDVINLVIMPLIVILDCLILRKKGKLKFYRGERSGNLIDGC